MNPPVVSVCLHSPYDFWCFSAVHSEWLRQHFPEMDLRLVSDTDARQELSETQVYFGWRFRPDWFPLAPRLAWIASPAAGTDHLPLAEAAADGVSVTRSYGFHGPPMAEHALGMILGFSRGLITSRRLQRTRTWWKDTVAEEFFDLAGATLAIIGCGSIGSHLAASARALGMHVIGVRRSIPVDDRGITWIATGDVAQAVAAADVVVNLLPASGDTYHYFERRLFGAFRPGALFVNLGRASTVDQQALLHALDTGRLRGAALDVTDPRPLPRGHPLRRHPRVLLTPKSAVFSRRYMDHAVAFFADNLRRYLTGQPLRGIATAAASSSLVPGG